MEEDNDETTEELKLPLMDADGNAVILRNRSSRRSERRSRRPMVRTRGSSLQRARASCRKRCTMICLRSWTAVINCTLVALSSDVPDLRCRNDDWISCKLHLC